MKKGARLIVIGNNETKEITYILTKLMEKISGFHVYSFDCEKKLYNSEITNETIQNGIDAFIGGDLSADNKCVYLYNYEMLGSNFNGVLRDLSERFPNIHFIVSCTAVQVIPEYLLARFGTLEFSNNTEFDKYFMYCAFNLKAENMPEDFDRNKQLITGKRLIIVDGYVETDTHIKLRENLISKYYDQKQFNTYFSNLIFEGEIGVNSLKNFLNSEVENNGRTKCVIFKAINMNDSKFAFNVVSTFVEQYPKVDFIFFTEVEFDFSFIPNGHKFQLYKLNSSSDFEREENYSKISEILNFK